MKSGGNSSKKEKRVRSRLTTRQITNCGLFVALMCIGAQIHIMIPIGTGVTVSLQIMFALLAGFLLGPRVGTLSVVIYLLLGLLGIPVYAHGGGIAYLLRPTYGFLIGFAAAAFLAGIVRGKIKKHSVVRYLIGGELAMLSYYLCGLLYMVLLSNVLLPGAEKIGFVELMTVWFLSSVGFDLIIGAIASLLAYRLVPLISSMQLD